MVRCWTLTACLAVLVAGPPVRAADPTPEEARNRLQSQNNLKNIVLAFHETHSNADGFQRDIRSADGKPLLPRSGQKELYEKFRKDEPWDSAHNKPLSETVVEIYCHPAEPGGKSARTRYLAVTGSLGTPAKPLPTVFALPMPKLNRVTDGTSNTLLVVEVAEAVPWAKPADFVCTPGKPPPGLSTLFADGSYTAFADGSIRMLAKSLPEETLEALLTARGREKIDWTGIAP